MGAQVRAQGAGETNQSLSTMEVGGAKSLRSTLQRLLGRQTGHHLLNPLCTPSPVCDLPEEEGQRERSPGAQA